MNASTMIHMSETSVGAPPATVRLVPFEGPKSPPIKIPESTPTPKPGDKLGTASEESKPTEEAAASDPGTESAKSTETKEKDTARQTQEIETVATSPYRRGMKAIEGKVAMLKDGEISSAEAKQILADEVKDDPLQKALLDQYALEKGAHTKITKLTTHLEISGADGKPLIIDSVSGSNPDVLRCTFKNPDGSVVVDSDGRPVTQLVTRKIIAEAHKEVVYDIIEADDGIPSEQRHILGIHRRLEAAKTTGESAESVLAAVETEMKDNEKIPYDSIDSLIKKSAVEAGIPVHEDLAAFISNSAEISIKSIDPKEEGSEDKIKALEVTRDERLGRLAEKEGVLATPDTIVGVFTETSQESRAAQIDEYGIAQQKLEIQYEEVKTKDPEHAQQIREKIDEIKVELAIFKDLTAALEGSGTELADVVTELTQGDGSITAATETITALRSGDVTKMFDAMHLNDRQKYREELKEQHIRDEKKAKIQRIMKRVGIGSAALMLAMLMMTRNGAKQAH